MKIFTKEFREELMGNLESIGFELNPNLPITKLKELNDKINLAVQKEREIANPKKKKNKKFKQGDIVYFGNIGGKVVEQKNDNSDFSLHVKFYNFKSLSFTKDGRFYKEMPIVISHLPYELKMKKIKE